MRRPGQAGKPRGSISRIAAMIPKETYQLLRDPSSIAIGIVMPLALLLLFGFGLNLDVKNVPVAIVVEDASADARGVASGFELSGYFKTMRVKTMAEAERLLLARSVSAIVRIPPDFARRVENGSGEVQVVVHGADANTARISLGYAEGAVAIWMARPDVGRNRHSGLCADRCLRPAVVSKRAVSGHGSHDARHPGSDHASAMIKMFRLRHFHSPDLTEEERSGFIFAQVPPALSLVVRADMVTYMILHAVPAERGSRRAAGWCRRAP